MAAGVLLSILFLEVSPESASQDGTFRGFADIHNHQFANLAFGGRAFVGEAFGPPATALDPGVDANNHGSNHWGDILGATLTLRKPGLILYSNSGYPTFEGWPNFYEWDHQKAYQDWLHRAVQGGMRLMVMMAVDSEDLCKQVATDGRNCANQMATIDRQLRAAHDMQDHIDELAGGAGKGWYRIVTTPEEARRVMSLDKLAVVLGVETAHLFDCRAGGCSWHDQLETYWNRGVRHFYPIHVHDNGFGGAAYFAPMLQGDVSYRRPCPEYARGECNKRGLAPTGFALINELMRRGAIIDVDHMSDYAWNETLTLAERNRGYPVVASHSGFNEINNNEQDHEGQLTAVELERIRNVGGMLGLISAQGNLWDVGTYSRPGRHTVNHVCGRTSETFAQAYLYAIDHAPGMAIGIGTDFAAPIPQPGPRFGGQQCFDWSDPGQPVSRNRDWTQAKWNGPLAYPFVARGVHGNAELDRYVFEQRTFDFNVDGLAHVGMLPDFFADLEALEIPAAELETLFTSAEGYVRMWERADRLRLQTSRIVAASLPEQMVAGQRYDVSVTLRNTGPTSWSPAPEYALGLQTPQDSLILGRNRIPLPRDLAPGDQVTFDFNVTAPSTTGTYTFTWQMVQKVQDNAYWFGEYAAHGVTVTRTAVPPPPPPPPPDDSQGFCFDPVRRKVVPC
jgi:microsomal dipeptidase-like Zn-dependent dipeptidase